MTQAKRDECRARDLAWAARDRAAPRHRYHSDLLCTAIRRRSALSLRQPRPIATAGLRRLHLSSDRTPHAELLAKKGGWLASRLGQGGVPLAGKRRALAEACARMREEGDDGLDSEERRGYPSRCRRRTNWYMRTRELTHSGLRRAERERLSLVCVPTSAAPRVPPGSASTGSLVVHMASSRRADFANAKAEADARSDAPARRTRAHSTPHTGRTASFTPVPGALLRSENPRPRPVRERVYPWGFPTYTQRHTSTKEGGSTWSAGHGRCRWQYASSRVLLFLRQRVRRPTRTRARLNHQRPPSRHRTSRAGRARQAEE